MLIRNIAIIAHVDHGKTTLVDALLRQSGLFRDNQDVGERVMDWNELERERGITILAKCASVEWRGTRINIVDTPGHADFGGEVERILGMVDGVLLLVDASEGPMPQTKFVTAKALKLGLRPIVVVNKVDKPDARPDAVHSEVFDLFAMLDASDEQLDFPVLFASAKHGWASEDSSVRDGDMAALFDRVVESVPAPTVEDGPFRMLVTTLEYDAYVGRVLTGRILSGTVAQNMTVKALSRAGATVERTRITKLLAFRGLSRMPIEQAHAGDIVAIAGFGSATVADTLCEVAVEDALPAEPVDPPTLAMNFAVNDSPLAGKSGTKVTSRLIRARLFAEAEGNVAIHVRETAGGDAFEVAGRGELQLGVLIETMRREGFELSISRPRVLTREDPETGVTLEPYEDVVIDVDEEFMGTVVESLAKRKGRLEETRSSGGGKLRLGFVAPSRGLRHRRDEPRVPRVGPVGRHDRRTAQRRADLERRRQIGRLRADEPGRARRNADRFGRRDLRRHDHRREQPLGRPRGQPDEGQAADQHPRLGHRRGGAPDALPPPVARTGDRLHPGRRAGRGDTRRDPPAQASTRPQRPQEGRPRGGLSRRSPQ